MARYEEILLNILKRELGAVQTEQTLHIENSVVGARCYFALEQIKRILEDDTLEDDACVERIERILSVYESLGSGCTGRHDFG